MNIEHLSKHLIQEHIYNNLSSLCRFMFVASMRRSGWEARKAAAKCFLWKPCSVVRKYSTPGNVRHICLHPTLFSHFWDFSSTSRFLCWPLLCLFAQMLFPVPCHRWCKCGVIGVNPSQPYEPGTLPLPPSPWCEHLLMWNCLLHLQPPFPPSPKSTRPLTTPRQTQPQKRTT